jgi:HAD superfamily hydrolase (TIGR01509 family)
MEFLKDIKWKGAIFDLDETLIETMDLWTHATQTLLSRYGVQGTDELMERCNSLSVAQSAAYLIDMFSLPYTVDSLSEEIQNLVYRAYADDVGLKDGAFEYLSTLHKKGVKMAIATSNMRELVLSVLKRNGVDTFFDCICCADEENTDKTSPRIYLSAAEKIGLQPKNCVVFEDLEVGINSAKSAGFYTVAVLNNSPWYNPENLRQLADSYIYSYRELLAD